MSLLSFSEHSPFAKSVIKGLNKTAMLKYPENVDDSHFIRFHFVEFPDINTRTTRGPQTLFDYQSQSKGPKTFGQSSIFLYMPQDIQISNGQEWETVELGIFGKTLQEIQASGRDTSISSDVVNILKGVGNVALQAAYNITGFENIKAATTQKIVNPFKDVVYKGPQLRTFSFKWTLVPHSEKDCETIKNIMDSFRYHAAPTKATDSGLSMFGFPGAFEISFHSYNGAFNQWLPQLGYCVATNVSSNYSTMGMFASYRNGHPTEVELSIEMQEIQIITRAELANENPNSMAAQSNGGNNGLTEAPTASNDNLIIYQESDLYKPVEIA